MKTLVFTGGHHTSGLEVAKNLATQGWHIVWFGHKYTSWGNTTVSGEFIDVTRAGIPFIDLKAGKFFHTYHPLKLIRIPYGFIQAFFCLLRLRLNSDLRGIVSFGGYLAVPTVVTGWILGISSITHEQTVVTGWANKFISKFVKKIAVTWPLDNYPSKVTYTGLPLRPEFQSKIHKPDQKLIFVLGGKQGSHRLNEMLFSILPELLSDYKVIHQIGGNSIYKDHEIAAKIVHPNYQYFTYDSQKAISALVKSSLVISRSGAHTVYELAALQKKCVLIPIPWVSHNEQFLNAKLLVTNNQALLLEEKNLTPTSLLAAISESKNLIPGSLNVPLDATQKLAALITDTFK